MQSLNIKLKNTTARHRRRAVWRYGLIFCFFVIIFLGAHVYFTRNPFSVAPKNTSAIIVLSPSKHQWEYLLKTFGHEPLVSGVGLFELSPCIKKSVALFITNDGSRFVGIHGKLDEGFSKKLESYGLNVVKINKHTTIIGVGNAELEPKKWETNIINRISPRFAGSITVFDEQAHSYAIYITKTGLKIRVDSTEYKLPLIKTDKIMFFGAFSNTKTAIPMPVEDLFSKLSGGTSLSETLLTNDQIEGNLTITKDGKYLVELENFTQIDNIQKILQMQSNLTNLSVVKRKLPDGSETHEVRAGENAFENSSSKNGEWLIIKPKNSESNLFSGINESKQKAFFTNSIELLNDKVAEKQNKWSLPFRKTVLLHILVKNMVQMLKRNDNYFSTPLPLSNTSFVHIGIDKNIFGSFLRLNNAQTVENF
jgi:hypothetical protein